MLVNLTKSELAMLIRNRYPRISERSAAALAEYIKLMENALDREIEVKISDLIYKYTVIDPDNPTGDDIEGKKLRYVADNGCMIYKDHQ
jgi:hypothetical protein